MEKTVSTSIFDKAVNVRIPQAQLSTHLFSGEERAEARKNWARTQDCPAGSKSSELRLRLPWSQMVPGSNDICIVVFYE